MNEHTDDNDNSTDNTLEQGFFCVIPLTVMNDCTLSPNAILLYARLTSLARQKGYAYASNKFLTKFFDSRFNRSGDNNSSVCNSSVSRWLKQLEDAGHIKCVFNYDKDRKQIISRHIFIAGSSTFPKKKPPQEPEQLPEPAPQPQPVPEPVPQTDPQGGVLHHCNRGVALLQGGCCTTASENYINSKNINYDEKNLKEAAAAYVEKPPEFLPSSAATGSFSVNSLTPQAVKDSFAVISNENNSALVFDNDFYTRASNHLKQFDLDLEFIPWLYDQLSQKKVDNMSNYLFKTFFQTRYIELYRQINKTKPQAFFSCPVCSLTFEDCPDICPNCSFQTCFADNFSEINKHYALFTMPDVLRSAYENELHDIIHSSIHFSEKSKKIDELDLKYKLNPG